MTSVSTINVLLLTFPIRLFPDAVFRKLGVSVRDALFLLSWTLWKDLKSLLLNQLLYCDWIYLPLIHTTEHYEQVQRHRYLHNSQIITAPAKPFSSPLRLYRSLLGNGFQYWRFLRFTLSGSIFTAFRAKLTINSHIYTDHVETPRFHCYSPAVALLRFCYLTTGTCLPNRCPEKVSVYGLTA
jgi:hypothetical protein